MAGRQAEPGAALPAGDRLGLCPLGIGGALRTAQSISEIVEDTGITRSSLYRYLPPRPPATLTAETQPNVQKSRTSSGVRSDAV